MHDQLGQRPIEAAVGEGKALGRAAMDFDAWVTLADSLDKRHRRVDGSH
jgi:hypothetical protein